jgi:hypothetical protein
LKIDSELTKALLKLDSHLLIGEDAPIRKVIPYTKLDWDTEVDISKDRTADILVTINYKNYRAQHKVVIEIENDREFDPESVLRRVKRGAGQNSIIVIIPKEFERSSFHFQKAKIPVWLWTATCRWQCRNCDNVTTSSVSLTPSHCHSCGKSGFLRWIEPEDIKFEPAENNPQLEFKDARPPFYMG